MFCVINCRETGVSVYPITPILTRQITGLGSGGGGTLGLNLNLNLNSLLVKRQIDNPSPGAVTGGNQILALTREVNLDTLSSDSSEEEIRDSGRSFQSLIFGGKKLYI